MKIHKLWFISLVLIISSIIVFSTACIPPDSQPESYKVGAVVFLTGPQATLGTEVKNAITIALDELNTKGGVKGKKLEVLFEDSKDSPKDAILAFNKLLGENVSLVICTGDVVSLNLAPMADEKKIPLIATVAAGPEITKKGKWVFRSFVQADRQGAIMADYAYKSLNLKSVAALHINNEFGEATAGNFKTTFETLGGKMAATETYGITDKDIRAQITKLKAANPDAIYVSGFGEGYGAAIKQVRELGFKGLLLSDNTLSIPYFQQQTTPANEGAYFTSTLYDENSNTPPTSDFIKSYKAKFNSDPSFIAAFAYDTMKIAAGALEKGGTSNDGIKNSLLSLKDYQGIIGKIGFTSEGDLNFPLAVKKIEQGKITVVSKGEYDNLQSNVKANAAHN